MDRALDQLEEDERGRLAVTVVTPAFEESNHSGEEGALGAGRHRVERCIVVAALREDGVEAGVVSVVGDHSVDDLAHAGAGFGAGIGGYGALDLEHVKGKVGDAGEAFLGDRSKDGVLVGEVLVEGTRRGTRGEGDALRGRAGVPLGRELTLGCREEGVARAMGALLLGLSDARCRHIENRGLKRM